MVYLWKASNVRIVITHSIVSLLQYWTHSFVPICSGIRIHMELAFRFCPSSKSHSGKESRFSNDNAFFSSFLCVELMLLPLHSHPLSHTLRHNHFLSFVCACRALVVAFTTICMLSACNAIGTSSFVRLCVDDCAAHLPILYLSFISNTYYGLRLLRLRSICNVVSIFL